MNESFGARLKSARLLNGLSLQGLADLLGNHISRQAIHRYEKGEVMPDSEMLALLSERLKVRQDYFFRDTKVELGKIEYRKLKRMSAREEQKVAELTRDYLSRYLELEQLLSIDVPFVNPLVGGPEVNSYEQVNKAAIRLREQWCLGCDPLYNVAELLEDKGIKVVKVEADLAFDGLQTLVNDNIPVIAYNAVKHQKADRVRFTLLHELAHLLLEIDPSLSHKESERLCNQFAAAMLLPESTIKEELGTHRNRLSIQELGNMKRQYGISIQAIAMRALACGIVSDNYISQFFFMINRNGWKIDEPPEYDYKGQENSCRFDQLLYRALVEEQISMSKAAALKNQSLAEFRQGNAVL